MTDRYVTMQTGERDGLRVCRVSYTRIDGRTSRIRFHYLVADRDGIRHAEENHELGLFTVDEMTASFHAAGLEPAYDPEGLTGRGLYLARRGADTGSSVGR